MRSNTFDRRQLMAAAVVGFSLASVAACTLGSAEEAREVSQRQMTADASADSGLEGAAAEIAALAEGGKVDPAAAQAALDKRKVGAVRITIKRRTSASEQVLGTKVEGSAEVKVLGPVTVKVEGKADVRIGQRLVITTDDDKYIIAGAPSTVQAALDALLEACTSKIKTKTVPVTGSPDRPTQNECCEIEQTEQTEVSR